MKYRNANINRVRFIRSMSKKFKFQATTVCISHFKSICMRTGLIWRFRDISSTIHHRKNENKRTHGLHLYSVDKLFHYNSKIFGNFKIRILIDRMQQRRLNVFRIDQ